MDGKPLENAAPAVQGVAPRRPATEADLDDASADPIDAREVFDIRALVTCCCYIVAVVLRWMDSMVYLHVYTSIILGVALSWCVK